MEPVVGHLLPCGKAPHRRFLLRKLLHQMIFAPCLQSRNMFIPDISRSTFCNIVQERTAPYRKRRRVPVVAMAHRVQTRHIKKELQSSASLPVPADPPPSVPPPGTLPKSDQIGREAGQSRKPAPRSRSPQCRAGYARLGPSQDFGSSQRTSSATGPSDAPISSSLSVPVGGGCAVLQVVSLHDM